MTRIEINEWIKISSWIIENPRKKIVHPTLQEVVEYQIETFPKYDRMEVRMKCGEMENFYTVTISMID